MLYKDIAGKVAVITGAPRGSATRLQGMKAVVNYNSDKAGAVWIVGQLGQADWRFPNYADFYCPAAGWDLPDAFLNGD